MNIWWKVYKDDCVKWHLDNFFVDFMLNDTDCRAVSLRLNAWACCDYYHTCVCCRCRWIDCWWFVLHWRCVQRIWVESQESHAIEKLKWRSRPGSIVPWPACFLCDIQNWRFVHDYITRVLYQVRKVQVQSTTIERTLVHDHYCPSHTLNRE